MSIAHFIFYSVGIATLKIKQTTTNKQQNKTKNKQTNSFSYKFTETKSKVVPRVINDLGEQNRLHKAAREGEETVPWDDHRALPHISLQLDLHANAHGAIKSYNL